MRLVSVITVAFFPVLAVVTGLEVFGSMLLCFVLYHFCVCLALPVLHWGLSSNDSKKLLSESYGLSINGKLRSVTAGFLTGTVFVLLTFGVFTLWREELIAPVHISGTLASWGLKPGWEIPLLIYFVLFNSIAEEFFWRGYLYGRFKQLVNAELAGIVVSFFFVQYHYYTIRALWGGSTALVFIVVLFAGSVIWCYLRERFGNVLPVMISHLMADLSIALIYWLWVIRA